MKKFHFFRRSLSAAVAVMRKACDWSVLAFVLLGMLTSQSIERMQATKEAEETAGLTQVCDAAVQAIAEQRQPDSPEKTERLKVLNKEIGEEIARVHREYE